MKAYQVQFTLPVNNPEENVFRTLKKTVVIFEVPINLPDINTKGYSDFVALAKDREILDISTALKNKSLSVQEEKSSKRGSK